MNFCIYIQSAPQASAFTTLVNGTMYGTPAPGNAGYYITGVTGTRYAYQGIPTFPGTFSLQSVTAVTSVQITASSDNIIYTNSPYPSLSGGGITLGLASAVTLPGASTTTSTVTYARMPVTEVGTDYNSQDTAYFAYQLVSNGPLPCGPAATTSRMTFYYTAVSQPLNALQASYGSWGSCMSAILTVLGPYSYPVAGGTTRPAYVVTGATGYRVFTDKNGVSTTVAISPTNNGVGGGSSSLADGADFMLYTTAPYVDDAGLTFNLAGIPQWPNSNDPTTAQNLQLTYVNIWSNPGTTFNGANYATEAVYYDTVNNQLLLSVNPYTGGSVQQCANSQFTVSPTGVSAGSTSSSSSSSDLSGGDIAGIVIGTVAGAILLMLLTACMVMTMCGGGAGKSAAYAGKPAGLDELRATAGDVAGATGGAVTSVTTRKGGHGE